MLCLYSSEMTIQLQTSQSCSLSMLNVVLTSQEALWWIEILALLQIFDEKSARFRWLSSISLLLIIFKWTVKVKLWIRLSRTICYENNEEKLLFASQYIDKHKEAIKLCIRPKALYNCMIKIDCFLEAIWPDGEFI